MASLLANLAVIIALEYLVLLLFFKREWLPCFQFAALANAITYSGGMLLYGKVGLGFWAIVAITTAIEALGIYFFWIVKPQRALAISIVANLVSAMFFPLLGYLGIPLPW